jgi:hypothetical protein
MVRPRGLLQSGANHKPESLQWGGGLAKLTVARRVQRRVGRLGLARAWADLSEALPTGNSERVDQQ